MLDSFEEFGFSLAADLGRCAYLRKCRDISLEKEFSFSRSEGGILPLFRYVYLSICRISCSILLASRGSLLPTRHSLISRIYCSTRLGDAARLRDSGIFSVLLLTSEFSSSSRNFRSREVNRLGYGYGSGRGASPGSGVSSRWLLIARCCYFLRRAVLLYVNEVVTFLPLLVGV